MNSKRLVGITVIGATTLYLTPQSRRTIRTLSTASAIALDYSFFSPQTHQRSASRLLSLCLINGGIFIKLGQHLSSLVYLLPREYTTTLAVLQDKCTNTPLHELEKLFINDTGSSISDTFQEFDQHPLGVASLAQVHSAVLKDGKKVAVKIQHPHLEYYTEFDIAVCKNIIKLAKYAFPNFKLDWLGIELSQSIPQELDFRLEADNAEKSRLLFAPRVHIPVIYSAYKRILVMEYIAGGKVDDLDYMESHGISKYSVSSELARLYGKMIFSTGFVHCGMFCLIIRSTPWQCVCEADQGMAFIN